MSREGRLVVVRGFAALIRGQSPTCRNRVRLFTGLRPSEKRSETFKGMSEASRQVIDLPRIEMAKP